MKTQQERERQAVVIGTALALFVVVVVVQVVVVALIEDATGREVAWASMWAVAAAGLLAAAYLVRHRR